MKEWLRKKQSWVLIGVAIAAIAFIVAWRIEYSRHMASELALKHTIQEKTLVEAQLSVEEDRANKLSEALDIKISEIELVIERLESEAQTVKRLNTRLANIESQMGQLQAELVLAMRDRAELTQQMNKQSRHEPVELEKITVSGLRPVTVEGKVVQISRDWHFVIVDLGWEFLSVGDILGVYRKDALVAEVQVERVQEEVAAARVLPSYEVSKIVLEDRVVEL